MDIGDTGDGKTEVAARVVEAVQGGVEAFDHVFGQGNDLLGVSRGNEPIENVEGTLHLMGVLARAVPGEMPRGDAEPGGQLLLQSGELERPGRGSRLGDEPAMETFIAIGECDEPADEL